MTKETKAGKAINSAVRSALEERRKLTTEAGRELFGRRRGAAVTEETDPKKEGAGNGDQGEQG